MPDKHDPWPKSEVPWLPLCWPWAVRPASEMVTPEVVESFFQRAVESASDCEDPDDYRFGRRTVLRAGRMLADRLAGAPHVERRPIPDDVTLADVRAELMCLKDRCLAALGCRSPEPTTAQSAAEAAKTPVPSPEQPAGQVIEPAQPESDMALTGDHVKVLEAYHKRQPILLTRSDLAEETGLTRKTIGPLVDDLVLWRLATEPRGSKKVQ